MTVGRLGDRLHGTRLTLILANKPASGELCFSAMEKSPPPGMREAEPRLV